MSAIRNVWGGSFDITAADGGDEDRPSEEEVKQRWLLQPPSGGWNGRPKAKRTNSLPNGKSLVKIALLLAGFIGFVTLISLLATGHFRRRHVAPPVEDNYSIALRLALQFFNAQRWNNVTWRGDSCLNDDPAGGYYDGGDAVKFTFPTSFSMTLLSWSVIEYSGKYESMGELDHVKSIIKWGTDYLLRTFNSSSAHSIDHIISQVGGDKDNQCWIRPEEISYARPVTKCYTCPALAADMAAALAAASIVFKDDGGQGKYSKTLVHGAETLFRFATGGQGLNYAGGMDQPSSFYNSSGFWDEFVWGGAWLYCATGNITYLKLVTSPVLAAQKDSKPHPFWRSQDRRVFSWNNKHIGAELLLTRIRIFLSNSYPYETLLIKYHRDLEQVICSYMSYTPSEFRRTNGGLILLNGEKPRPIHYAVNAVFLAALYGDYLASGSTSGWHCGSGRPVDDLRRFAANQVNYILGKNPRGASYVVGYGEKYPSHVHHRGASIPDNNVKYGCEKGLKFKDSQKPDPNIISGAMVGGPYGLDDKFKDVRANYSYTEPSIVGNAGLVASLVALSSKSGGDYERFSKVDVNAMYEVAVDAEATPDRKLEVLATVAAANDLETLPLMVAAVCSDDRAAQLDATFKVRRLLCIDSPPINEVVQSGVVPRFVEFLARDDNPRLQFEAAWALTNIAYGTSENTKVVTDHGAVPILVRLLSSPAGDVREQAVWALGNIAGDSPKCRDLVLRNAAFMPLLAQFSDQAKLSMLRIATWTLSNFCRGKPQPSFDQTKHALPVLERLIHSDDEEVLTNVCWALSHLSVGTNDKIQAVIEIGVCPRLVELLLDSQKPDPDIIFRAMVGGPYGFDDKFKDVQANYSYTEPSIVGNSSLAASLVAVSSKSGGDYERFSKVDVNAMFSAVPPLYKH
ncbi:Endoglucanase 25 [Linum perenne]